MATGREGCYRSINQDQGFMMTGSREKGNLTIILHNGHRYEIEYKYRDQLIDYFANQDTPQLVCETTDGLWVYLQKGAIAAIEASADRAQPKIRGFATIGEIPAQ